MSYQDDTADPNVNGKKPWEASVSVARLRDPSVSIGARLLYANLCGYMNDDHVAWPGYGRLADDLGASKATVKRYIEELESAGWISKKNRYNAEVKAYNSNQYTIHVPVHVPARSPEGGGTGDPTMVRSTTHMKIEPVEKDKHIYKVGIGADTRLVVAPNAKAAALFYALHGIDLQANNPFMVTVYAQDEEPYAGEAMPWADLAFSGSQSAALEALEAVKPDLARSRFTLDLGELRDATSIFAKCPLLTQSLSWYRRQGFVEEGREMTRSGKTLVLLRLSLGD